MDFGGGVYVQTKFSPKGSDVARNLDRPSKIKKLDPRLANFLRVQMGFWTTEISETSKNRIEIYVDPTKVG